MHVDGRGMKSGKRRRIVVRKMGLDTLQLVIKVPLRIL
jgi:hypothetical protein